jgi:hypothetical protein
MSCTCHRTRVLVMIGVGMLAACGEDGARELADAADMVEADADSRADTSEPNNPEADAGAEPGDAGPGSEEEDAGATPGSRRDAQAESSGEGDAAIGLEGSAGHNLGSDCHHFDFDGPQSVIVRQMVSAHWPAPVGGSIVPGTYDLVSEQRLVAADATPEQADACDDYDGAYWERIVLTADEWSRLNRNEDHTVGRQIFQYSARDGRLERTQTCPDPEPYEPRSYSASATQLLLFDELHEDGEPPYCEYLFTYVRKQ